MIGTQRPGKTIFRRLPFIDFARGIVMILMALDHASIYWNPGRASREGLNGFRPYYISFAQFLTRFVTHYCAPTFIFLAGTALALSTSKRLRRGESQLSISRRMVIRGVLLIAIEFLLIAPVFRIGFFYFGVLACIGTCFVIFSILRFLPTEVIFAISSALVAFHSYLNLDWIPSATNWGYLLHLILHEPSFYRRPWVGLYPIIPWLGVMGLGWCFGQWILAIKDKDRLYEIDKLLASVGMGLIVLFFALRYFNGFGNDLPWLELEIIDFFTMAKYPPSLVFLLWTLGGTMLMLCAGIQVEKRNLLNSKPVKVILTYGSVPLFFYCAHLLLYSSIPISLGLNKRAFSSLGLTYLVWIVGLALLYPICRWYKKLKKAHPNSFLQYI